MPFLLLSCLFSCNKQGTVAPTPCIAEMRNFFSQDLKCSLPGSMEVHLQQAEYEGQLLYFTEIMCIYCGVAPTTVGYNCNKEKVEFKESRRLRNVRRVFDSCKNEYL